MSTTTPTIRIFRPGQFVSAEGRKVSFAAADLEATVAAYDGEAAPAPLVIGHPRMDAPAYGWVKSLKIVDGALVAEAGDVEASFADQVRAKRYRKVSSSFYAPNHPSNPSPGVWALRHVGFLGAMPPAVSGLGTVEFADADDHDLALTSLSPLKDPPVTDTPTATTPDTTAADEQAASFAERETAIAERERLADERDREAAERASAETHTAHVTFAEAQITAGKLTPAGQYLVVGLLDQLASAETVSFGEAGELAPADALRRLFDDANPVVSFGAHPDSGAPEDAPTASFSAPEGLDVNEDKAALHAKARALQGATPGLAFLDAVKRVESAA